MEDEVKDEFHPAVKLLLARMESNPEEFIENYRWSTARNMLVEYANAEETAALTATYSRLQMDAVHTAIMKELLRDPAAEEKARADMATSSGMVVAAGQYQQASSAAAGQYQQASSAAAGQYQQALSAAAGQLSNLQSAAASMGQYAQRAGQPNNTWSRITNALPTSLVGGIQRQPK